MYEKQNELFHDLHDAEQYVEVVREHYRLEHGSYQGNRNEEQQLIAEVTGDEAQLVIDGVMAGILALGNTNLPNDYEKGVTKGGHNWEDLRNEYEKMLVGFGVITNRLHRDGYAVPEYAELGFNDRMKTASILLSDFLSHNALRFGVDTAGVHKTLRPRIYDDIEGEMKTVSKIVDKDKAQNDREVGLNMATRKFRSGEAAHPALKLSPEAYKKLRKKYPEIDKDDFDQAVSTYRNVREKLESQE